MPKKSHLSIIILSYNSQFWLKKTLQTLKHFYLDQTKTRVKTIVVDNASQDGSPEMVKKKFKWVSLIELEKNLGYSAGNNIALRKIQSDYVMLLNNDVELSSDSNFDRLLNYLERNASAGVITPEVLLPSGKLDLACHRGEPTPWAAFTYYSKLEKLFPKSKLFSKYHQLYKPMDQIHQIDACSGAAMMVKKKAIDQVVLLDESFFMYGEDLDWCHRFRQAGWEIIFHPHVKVVHHKYKSGIKSESDITSYKIRIEFYNAMLKYYDKHFKELYPRMIRWLLRAFIFIRKGGY